MPVLATESQFKSWLTGLNYDSATIICEAGVKSGGTEITRYLSTKGYHSSIGNYLPIISGGFETTELLNIDGEASLSTSDLTLVNFNHQYDSWLNDIWDNRPIKLWLGFMRFGSYRFWPIFDGLIQMIDVRDKSHFVLKIADKLQSVNTPVSEAKIGGTGENKDALIPIALGEICNGKGILTDDPTHEYQVHNGPFEGIIEHRDDGVPTTITPHTSTGKYNLTTMPYGDLCCSIQGGKWSGVYYNTIADLIKILVKNYGKASTQLTNSDIDLTNFSDFNTANPYVIGKYITSTENVLAVCQEMASSAGAKLISNALGKLQLFQINLPATGTAIDFTAKDIKLDSLHIGQKIPIVGAVKLGYCKNWNPSDYPDSAIPEVDRNLLKTEWRTVTKTDATTIADYKLSEDSTQIDTLLVNVTQANTEAQRRLDFGKTQRWIYEFDGLPQTLFATIGQSATLTHPTLNLSAGKSGMIVKIRKDWGNLNTTVGVLT